MSYHYSFSPPSIINNKGFTLLELIVVSVLISLFLFLTIPSLSEHLSNPLKTVSRKIVFLLQHARQVAGAEQLFCKVSYNRDNKQFSTEFIQNSRVEQETASFTKAVTLLLPESIEIIEAVQGKATLPIDNFTIWIGPQGYMQPLVLHLANKDNDYISIHVEPLLFKSDVFDEYTPLAKKF